MRNRLDHTRPIRRRQNNRLAEHVKNRRHENPPVISPVRLIEKRIPDPDVLIIVKPSDVALKLLELPRRAPDLVAEKGQYTGEQRQGNSGEDLSRPGVTLRELKDAVQHPDTVQEHDERGDGARDRDPVVLAETGKLLGEGAEEGPELEDDFDEKETDNDGGDDNSYNEQNRHEHVGRGDGELLDVLRDAVDGNAEALGVLEGDGTVSRLVGCVRLGEVDAGLDLASGEADELVDGALDGQATITIAVLVERHGAVVGKHERGVFPEEHKAVVSKVSARLATEVVDGGLHGRPRDDSRGKAKVFGEVAVDGRIVDGQHAVHRHALEKAKDFGEAGADGAHAGAAGGSSCSSCGRTTSSNGSSSGRNTGQDQGGTGHTGGDI